MPKIIPVIMSGGSGTRLWPLSTPKRPKQFHALATERTMLQETALRFKNDDFLSPIVVCGEAHSKHVLLQFEAFDSRPQTIICEPFGRNTAAVAALSALEVKRLDPDALVLLLPVDHVITRPKDFITAILAATQTAKLRITTFGITPTRPETGYGYIEHGAPLGDDIYAIKQFLEKPDLATAKSYVAGGQHDWNAGIFLFAPDVMLTELEVHAKDVLHATKDAYDKSVRDALFVHLDAQAFEAAPSISIDYAVMEKTSLSAVKPCNIGWADVGSFAELYELAPKDDTDNYLDGPVRVLDVKGSMVRSQSLPVAVIGLSDIMVVATDEGVLVAPLDRAQDVKFAAQAFGLKT